MPTATSKQGEPEDYDFNDAQLNGSNSGGEDESPKDSPSKGKNAEGGDNYVPRPKRIACVLCRKRKLRCDGTKPSCGTCSRLGHDCAYDEVRKKSGPKRGYVKLLEQRLKQVENLLENRETLESSTKQQESMQSAPPQQSFNLSPPDIDVPFTDSNVGMGMMEDASFMDPSFNTIPQDFSIGATDDFSWEMIGLGLDEPLPTQDIIDDMTQIYFEKVHPSLPMIHRPRFLAAMDLAPHMRPPVGLRYAMWTHACSMTPRYSALVQHFYARARKYLQQDEMRGHGESMVTLAHAQAWTLVGCFEFKVMFFPRAWMSCGRATRLAQMMGLHRQDGVGLDVKQTLAPARDWTEREERRRTFWMVFCQDRYASIGTGWPMTIDEADILTNLPAPEEAFNKSKPEPTSSLSEAMTGDGASTLSSFAGVILMACLFGRNLTHLHRPMPDDRDHDLNGEFWKRHRMLDNILLNTALMLPPHLRLPEGIHTPNIIFCNMNIHTSTICLHQAAIFKADKNGMAPQISAESKRRCIIAADQISNIMKMASNVDLSLLNPFISFCLYVAARVFVQYLKSRKEDATVKSSLQFLLNAMSALKTKNPLTESFLVQLEVDLDGSELDIKIPTSSSGIKVPSEIPINTDAVKCSPLYEIRESQARGQNGILPTAPRPQTNPPLMATNGMPMNFDHPPTFESVASRPKQPRHLQHGVTSGVNGLYNEAHSWDGMDTSPDTSGDSMNFSRPHSDGISPSSNSNSNSNSNKASSHTSFSPQHLDSNSSSGPYTSSSSGVSPNVPNPMFPNSNNYGQMNPPAEGTSGMGTPFAMPPNWDYSNDGSSNTLTGQQQHSLNNISEQSTVLSPGATGMTPIPMPDWQGLGMGGAGELGEAWMYGDWPGQTPQPQ